MNLNKNNLEKIKEAGMEIPNESIFNLPEKILQFGTGVLLRGLCDHYVDIANKQNVFNGRIVVVKSTSGGNEFADQDNLYTLCLRGINENIVVENNFINASISRVLLAKEQWSEIIEVATNDSLTIVLSNTTEVGIVYKSENILTDNVPESFPAKLLAVLYARFNKFKGDENKGLVIVPTELITGNAAILKSIVVKLANENNLGETFLNWLNSANTFCNTLVDRIVTGKPKGELEKKINMQLPYADNLKVVAELYNLWAIQGNQNVKEVLSFASVNPEIIIEEDIDIYRELKLRLLNGSHTFHCGFAHLLGFDIVRNAFQNSSFIKFAQELIYKEIASSIPYEIDSNTKEKFADSLFDRFVNPFLEHKWLDITLHYSAKMKMRNSALLTNYYKVHNELPECMCIGFAAYIYFMKETIAEDGFYYGTANGKLYKIQDAEAKYFSELWNSKNINELVLEVTTNQKLWDTNIDLIPGFTNKVAKYLTEFAKGNCNEILKKFEANTYAK